MVATCKLDTKKSVKVNYYKACPNDMFISVCNDGDVRLVDGNSAFNGRLEICFDNVWGTVCGRPWSDTEAAVVCRQLGYDTNCKCWCTFV